MKIRGNTIGTTMPRPDWNQTNPRRADYILNKPRIDNIICTANGDVIAVADSSDHPLQNLTLYGKSVQNGTPTPDAPVPIASAGGKYGSISLILAPTTGTLQILQNPQLEALQIDDRASLKVAAVGKGLTYQWQYRSPNGGSWKTCSETATPGCTTAAISPIMNAARVGQSYRCIVTDESGNSITSAAVTLAEYTAQIITKQPKSVTARVGEICKMSVEATGDGLTYQWQWFKETINDWSTTSNEGNRTPELTIEATEARNGYRYRCVVVDADGTSHVSLPATLNIAADFQRVSVPMADGLRSAPVNGEDVCDCIDLMANDIERNTVKINLPTDPLKWTPVADIDGCVYYTQLEEEAASGSGVLCAYLENGNPLATDDSVWSKNLIYVENNYLYISCCRDEWLTDDFLEEHENVEMEVIYARKEPLHEQLMTAEYYKAVAELHTYKPNTTIINDAGAGMAVEYVADTKAYIDNKFTELAAAIVSNV